MAVERDFEGYLSDYHPRVPREEPLTKTQLKVMEYLSHGFSSEMVAEELKISQHTVKKHVEDARTRMAAKTRAHLIAKLLRRGMLH